MKFYTKPILRYCYRYLWLVVFCGIPAYLTISAIADYPAKNSLGLAIICGILFVYMAGLTHYAFWEKFFASIQIDNDQVIWRCPFRKTRTLPFSECWIGVELEDAHNGLDYPLVYFSRNPYPEKYRSRINKMKVSPDFIKFWYSEELAEYIIRNVASQKMGSLQYYRNMQKADRRKKKNGSR